jgi:hypothetical protein
MQTEEKKKAKRPVSTESVRRVKRTLILTFPQRRVVRSKFASLLRSKTAAAALFPDSTSISSFRRVKPNKPRVRPEKTAD